MMNIPRKPLGMALAAALCLPEAIVAQPALPSAGSPVARQSIECVSTDCLELIANVRHVHRKPVVRPARRTTVVIVRPVRRWVHRPYYGAVVAGVVVGTVIVASTVPQSPRSDLCWYWSDSYKNKGYWDYCKPR